MHFKHNRYYDGLKSTEEVQRVEYVLLKIGEYVRGEKCWGGNMSMGKSQFPRFGNYELLNLYTYDNPSGRLQLYFYNFW